MPIITISRRSFSQGSIVAEKVAEKLGYRCISREVLLEASELYNVPEIKLSNAMEDSPSIIDRFTYGKEKYLAYIHSALLKILRNDNVVYHGLAGPFFLRGLTNVLKVQIIANKEDRIRLFIEKSGRTRKEALSFLDKLDNKRRKWSLNLHGVDIRDSKLYSLVLNLKDMTSDDAVEIISRTAMLDSFKTTEESMQKMEDLFLASEIKVALLKVRPDVEVEVENGCAQIKTIDDDLSQGDRIHSEINEVVLNIPGINDSDIQIIPF